MNLSSPAPPGFRAQLCCLQEPQTHRQVATDLCGFITIVIGTFLLHATRDLDITMHNISQLAIPPASTPSAEGQNLTRLPSISEHQMRRSLPSRTGESSHGWV